MIFMHDDRLKKLKTVLIIAAVILFLAAIAYAVWIQPFLGNICSRNHYRPLNNHYYSTRCTDHLFMDKDFNA
ncbi:hypothetical protein [Methanobacterium oryzae]|uniref:hypothetical protein n=1 Tax=Methanobacterium oryzae TaxID=69540 RepID=UPI003D1EA7B8